MSNLHASRSHALNSELKEKEKKKEEKTKKKKKQTNLVQFIFPCHLAIYNLTYYKEM